MLGYSRRRHEVYTLVRAADHRAKCKVEIKSRLLRLREVTTRQWRELRQLQGRLRVGYLKWRYGDSKTYVLLAWAGDELAHVEWVVPAHKVQSRYPFIRDGSYSIISCLTAERFQRLGIYPSQIQEVLGSAIAAEQFWIWAESTNEPSLKGIRKAGGAKVGEFIQIKWLWGCISRIGYFLEESDTR